MILDPQSDLYKASATSIERQQLIIVIGLNVLFLPRMLANGRFFRSAVKKDDVSTAPSCSGAVYDAFRDKLIVFGGVFSFNYVLSCPIVVAQLHMIYERYKTGANQGKDNIPPTRGRIFRACSDI